MERTDPTSALRAANAAAAVGEWSAVDALVAPLDPLALGPADRAEAHRLRGLAAFFAKDLPRAEVELLSYLRLDADAHLDPATVPPEAITYFDSVAAKHRAELRALREARVRTKKSPWIAVVPVAAQLQNGERAKAWVVAGSLTVFLAANLATYFTLRAWCDEGSGTCESNGQDRSRDAERLSVINLLAGGGVIAVVAYSMYDGVVGYKRSRTIAPNVGTGMIGLTLSGRF